MHFQVSGIDAPLWLPPAIAFGVSYFTSMGGVSGAFLLLPIQVSLLGYAAPSVTATNHVFNVLATPGGVYRYIRERRMVWPLAWTVLVGTLPGIFLGAFARVAWFPDPRRFKLFVGCVLVYIGVRMILDLRRGASRSARATSGGGIEEARFSLRCVAYRFGGERYSFRPSRVLLLCFAVGVIGGAYGIGGGALVAPFLVTILCLPVHTVAGATLLGTFASSLAGVLGFQLLGQTPDWALGLLFGAGGFCGTYFGARTQRFVRPAVIKALLCACVLFLGGRYVIGFFT